MAIKDFLKDHPVFQYETFQSFMQKNEGVAQDASIRQILSYYYKTGKITRIRRSLYAVNPEFSHSLAVDPYLVVAYASPDAIIAYHTALELHGHAYTTFNELTYLVKLPVRPFAFNGQYYRSVVQPKSLIDQQQTTNGVENLERQGLIIRVTTLERTLVDILDRPDLAGGWEEILRSMDHLVKFDTQKIVDYALLLNKSVTIAKVGYFLEQLPDYLKIDKAQVNRLLAYIPKQPYYLEPKQKGSRTSKYIAKWQLMIPDYITQRGWEEKTDDNV